MTYIFPIVSSLICDSGQYNVTHMQKSTADLGQLCIGLHADSMEPSWDSLSPSLSAPPLVTLSLNINKKERNERMNE